MSDSLDSFNQLFDENEQAEIRAQLRVEALANKHPDYQEVLTDDIAAKINADPILSERVQRADDYLQEAYNVAQELRDPLNSVFGDDCTNRGPEFGKTSATELEEFLK